MHDKPPLPKIAQEDWDVTPPAIRAVVVALLARIADLPDAAPVSRHQVHTTWYSTTQVFSVE